MTQPPQPPYGAPTPSYGAAPLGPFYLVDFAGEHGPFDYVQLGQMALSRQIKPDTVVRAAESDVRIPARQVPGLYSDKEWLVAVLLAAFLGLFGVDRFYLGQTGLGIAKLVVSLATCFLAGMIWQYVDLVLILLRKVTDAEGRPLP